MPKSHHWVTFSKGRINIKGCSHCGQILLPTNEHSRCHEATADEHTLHAKGYKIVEIPDNMRVA